jgi:hypothetical protein
MPTVSCLLLQRIKLLARPDPSWCPSIELKDRTKNELQKELRERLKEEPAV